MQSENVTFSVGGRKSSEERREGGATPGGAHDEDLVYNDGEGDDSTCMGPEAMCGGLDSVSSTMGSPPGPIGELRARETGAKSPKGRACTNWCGVGPHGPGREDHRGDRRGFCATATTSNKGRESTGGSAGYVPSTRAAEVSDKPAHVTLRAEF